MSDYYRTIGFGQDKARLFGLLDRIATALERIANYYEGDLEFTEKLANPDRWVSVAEAASLIDKSEPTLRRWAQSGRVEARKLGKAWMIKQASIEEPKASTVEDLRLSDLTDEEAKAFWEAINE